MATETIYRCDHQGCEQTRTPSNGWVIVKRWSGPHISVTSWSVAKVDGHLDEDASGVFMFCGQAHALHYISQCLPDIAQDVH